MFLGEITNYPNDPLGMGVSFWEPVSDPSSEPKKTNYC